MEIALDRLTLHRGGNTILREISWSLQPGERWLVVGASGAGKTQLLKILAGDVWPDESAHRSRRYRIQGTWHDEPVEVRDDIAWLGPERQDRYERYGWDFTAIQVVGTGLHRTDIPLQKLTAAKHTQSLALLRRAGIAQLAERKFLTLSYGERRLVLLVRALAWRADWLLLDEVATGLDDGNRQRSFRMLGGSNASAMSWVCSAHRMEDVPASADHLLWLVDGRVQYAGPLHAATLRRALRAEQPASAVRLPATVGKRRASSQLKRNTVRPVIEMQNATVWAEAKRLLTDIDIVIQRGDCWVVHGANGSGKSTLLRTLYGERAVASDGVIRRAGMAPGVPLEQFRARTGLIAPHLQTDYPRYYSVIDTVVSGLHSSIGLNYRTTAAERRRALASLHQFDLHEVALRPLTDLSYGQVRRVLFARAAVLRPTLLLLDEPFTGLNAPVRVALQQWLDGQIAKGVTVVLATHYRSEWPRHASHELMLARGRMSYAGTIRR
jgi:molybdate transport system ATP-binding protein